MQEPIKPITMLVDEFKTKFANLLNEAGLPAWVLMSIIEPIMKQLQQIDEASRKQEMESYQAALTEYMKHSDRESHKIEEAFNGKQGD